MPVEITPALSYDDVLLAPRDSAVLPRDVDITTGLHASIRLRLPLLSAAMDRVTESELAIALARQGGLGVIHKNCPVTTQASMVEDVKRSESGFISDPITLRADEPVGRAYQLMARFKVSGFPVTDDEGHLVGIVTNRDLRFAPPATDLVAEHMTSERLVTAPTGTTLAQAQALMQQHRVEKLPIVEPGDGAGDGDGACTDGVGRRLVGMFTFKDIEKIRQYPNSAKDERGRLLAAAAVAVGSDGEERAEALVAAGVDLLVIDSAHGHSAGVLEFAGKLKDRFRDVVLSVGNVATGDAVRACVDHGADVVKVGVGPGSICTTRVVTGVGMPQLTAVLECAAVARELGVATIADGGVRYSGDAVKALAAGAHAVMVGNLLAGTDESPGDLVLVGGRRYKEYRGMGSLDAMRAGSADRYFQDAEDDAPTPGTMSGSSKLVPEGVSGLLPYRGSLGEVTAQLEGGLRSGMGYVGARDLGALHARARFVQQSVAGARESHVHDLEVVHEAPNYSVPGRD